MNEAQGIGKGREHEACGATCAGGPVAPHESTKLQFPNVINIIWVVMGQSVCMLRACKWTHMHRTSEENHPATEGRNAPGYAPREKWENRKNGGKWG